MKPNLAAKYVTRCIVIDHSTPALLRPPSWVEDPENRRFGAYQEQREQIVTRNARKVLEGRLKHFALLHERWCEVLWRLDKSCLLGVTGPPF